MENYTEAELRNCGSKQCQRLDRRRWARVRWQVFGRGGWRLFPLSLGDPGFVCFLRFVQLAI